MSTEIAAKIATLTSKKAETYNLIALSIGGSAGRKGKMTLCPDYGRFQASVSEYLIRHRSILDVLTKLQEADARVNRAVAKAVTNCGCVKVNASRQSAPADISYREIKAFMNDHLDGELCEHCRDIVETEVGRSLFYLAALCDLLGLNLNDIMEKEQTRLSTLGMFNLT